MDWLAQNSQSIISHFFLPFSQFYTTFFTLSPNFLTNYFTLYHHIDSNAKFTHTITLTNPTNNNGKQPIHTPITHMHKRTLFLHQAPSPSFPQESLSTKKQSTPPTEHSNSTPSPNGSPSSAPDTLDSNSPTSTPPSAVRSPSSRRFPILCPRLIRKLPKWPRGF